MIATVHTATPLGTTAHPVVVEVHTARALPGFSILGTPDGTTRETRDRVRAAIGSAGYQWPNDQRITVNLTPTLEHRGGSGLDLAIAAGVLAATGQIPHTALDRHGFVGELGLDGTVRHTAGIAAAVTTDPDRRWIVPAVDLDTVRGVGADARWLTQLAQLPGAIDPTIPWPDPHHTAVDDRSGVDVDQIPDATRAAAAIAATGGHHLLLIGPYDPAGGGTARHITRLLDDLDRDAAIEATIAHSAAGQLRGGLISRPPLRTPHHQTPTVTLLGGGGDHLRPGEFTLAHRGVLYLNALDQLPATHLDALRQALTHHRIHLARGTTTATMPADFQLVAATARCACGAPTGGGCVCTTRDRQRHANRLAGPLLDHFDLRIDLEHPTPDQAFAGMTGDELAARVAHARETALDRNDGRLNARLDPDTLRRLAPLDHDADRLLREHVFAGRLTGRGHTRSLRVARTIADLDTSEQVTVDHVRAALAYSSRLHQPDPRHVDTTTTLAYQHASAGSSRGHTR